MKLRITPDGTVRGLWTDYIDWPGIGPVSVTRASHVEFCGRRQMWYVQAGRTRHALRRILQAVTGRPFGEILHWAKTREEALAWEQAHYEPGGSGWKQGGIPKRRMSAVQRCHTKEHRSARLESAGGAVGLTKSSRVRPDVPGGALLSGVGRREPTGIPQVHVAVGVGVKHAETLLPPRPRVRGKNRPREAVEQASEVVQIHVIVEVEVAQAGIHGFDRVGVYHGDRDGQIRRHLTVHLPADEEPTACEGRCRGGGDESRLEEDALETGVGETATVQEEIQRVNVDPRVRRGGFHNEPDRRCRRRHQTYAVSPLVENAEHDAGASTRQRNSIPD